MKIPIKNAKEFAQQHELSQIIIFGYDGKEQHVATWGRTVEDCASAAEGGNQIKTFCGWPNSLHSEPSRVRKLQTSLKQLESENTRLKALLKDAQELIHAPTGDPFEYKLKYDAFQVKLKREGIK